jgi:hypothetical protein
VLLHSGEQKRNQRAHMAVLDIDTGQEDLLQAADLPVRLRAEYLWASNQPSRIAFDIARGEQAAWPKWSKGYRPTFEADGVAWSQQAEPDDSYRALQAYLAEIFARTDTDLLARQMRRIGNPGHMRIGDVFIHPGQGGHAAIIVDIAEDVRTGQRIFLLAQGFQPAQQPYILANPRNPDLSPWYPLDFGTALQTPEYRFRESELMRFND